MRSIDLSFFVDVANRRVNSCLFKMCFVAILLINNSNSLVEKETLSNSATRSLKSPLEFERVRSNSRPRNGLCEPIDGLSDVVALVDGVSALKRENVQSKLDKRMNCYSDPSVKP